MKTDTESKRMENICQISSTQKKASANTILISVKVDSDTKLDKHFTMIKQAKSKEDFKMLSLYALKYSCKHKTKKMTELKGEIDKYTIIVEKFSLLF